MKINPKTINRMMGAHLMTQEGLAHAAGVSRTTINSTLLKGSCSVQTVVKIARAFDVDPAELIEQEGTR